MRETKLVTNCREMCDEGELKQRQELIQVPRFQVFYIWIVSKEIKSVVIPILYFH